MSNKSNARGESSAGPGSPDGHDERRSRARGPRDRADAGTEASAPVDELPDQAARTSHHLAPHSDMTTSWLDWLGTRRGTTGLTVAQLVLALVGVVLSAVTLFASSSATAIVGSLSLLIFLFLVWLGRRQGKRMFMVVSVLGLVFSMVLVIRTVYAPETSSFPYGGGPINTSGTPFMDGSRIPLTEDPAEGYVTEWIDEGQRVGELEISCTRNGLINTGSRSTNLEWAKIVGGPLRTLWVPKLFLGRLEPGTARTLLPCSNWRWRLRNLIFE